MIRPIRDLTTFTTALVLASTPLCAASKAEIDRLYNALGTSELIEIMRAEGLMQAEELRVEMFPEKSGVGWTGLAGEIYDTNVMAETFRSHFDSELATTDVTSLLEFFDSLEGAHIVELELSGRRALVDPDLEVAAKQAFNSMADAKDPRIDQLETFIDANDLIELNVMGAMNASLSFYLGLADGGGFEMGEDDMLADVWAQEPMIRADTSEWLYSYLALAYRPLSDAALDKYVALSTSPAGRDLNRALFAGFDEVFRDISYGLGRAASRFMVSEEL